MSTAPLPHYVLDTHVIFWHRTGLRPLPAAVQAVFQDAQAGKAILVISHVVLAELCFLLQKQGQVTLFRPMLAQYRGSPAYSIEPLVLDDIEQLPNFPEISEMHDRLLVIQSNRLGATLVTKDANIQSSPQVRWLW